MVAQLLISPAAAEEPAPARTDETVVTLKPGEATEVKLVMLKGAKVTFDWTVAGGVVNYDLHGDGTGNFTSYAKDRGVPGAQGVLEVAFDGNHGWFWRNRGKTAVTVTLKTKGAYSEIKRLLWSAQGRAGFDQARPIGLAQVPERTPPTGRRAIASSSQQRWRMLSVSACIAPRRR